MASKGIKPIPGVRQPIPGRAHEVAGIKKPPRVFPLPSGTRNYGKSPQFDPLAQGSGSPGNTAQTGET
jgi:hypothetical protein